MNNKGTQINSKGKLETDWKFYDPDGELIMTNNGKKARWYLNRGLGKIIGPKKIQFSFYPKIKARDVGYYNKVSISLCCVVCGYEPENLNSETGMQKHHVVPYSYRKLLPHEHKSRNHHDVVYICKKCHDKYEQLSKNFRHSLAERYNVKTNDKIDICRKMTKTIGKDMGFIRSLIGHRDKIPQERVDWMLEQLNKYGGDLNNSEYLKELYVELEDKRKSAISNAKSPSEQIIESLTTEEDVDNFLISWRQHFVDSMKPEYLPDGWDIYYKKGK